MNLQKWSAAACAILLLVLYNGAQPDIYSMRNSSAILPGTKNIPERYGPSYEWLDRAMGKQSGSLKFQEQTKLDFSVLSSMMVAGMASGFRSQVANLLWIKFDEYFHEGQMQRQTPIMEAVVTLDPNFVDAWRTIGWHWSYNIYAYVLDKPENDPKKQIKKGMTAGQIADVKTRVQSNIRREQTDALDLGLDYLRRGSNLNPDTYVLWFDQAQTRAWKAGIMDDVTIELYEESRRQKDARSIKTEQVINGKQVPVTVEGFDVVNHMKAHVYEQRPDIGKALDTWRDIMLANNPGIFAPKNAPRVRNEDIAGLQKVGEYWARYGQDYDQIVAFYADGDIAIKEQVKRIIPDIEAMAKAHESRLRTGAGQPAPTGAYITIVARYWPAWKLMQAGRTEDAIRQLVGVMNADPKYHLKGLNALARVLEVRGDARPVIGAQLQKLRDIERGAASQDIGFHFLAFLYEKLAAAKSGEAKRKYEQLAYETWYRGRMRDALDYYSLRKTYEYEDRGFKMPPQTLALLEKARDGARNFTPTSPQL